MNLLEDLQIQANYIKNYPNLSALTNLKYLDISQNPFSECVDKLCLPDNLLNSIHTSIQI